MTFLPMVHRELREASRRKGTFRLRWWVAILAMAVSFFSLLYAQIARIGGSAGNPAFGLFTGYVFGIALLAGIFLTADCISEEKRDGTLGLLFLTDLRGYDVVLGKFTARSLNAFYGLLALLPLAGVPVLLGGVTGGEFWRMALALVNALFFSLSAGLFVSCLARDAHRAMGGALVLILLFGGGLPALAELSLRLRFLGRWTPLAWISPFYPYAYAIEPLYLFHRGTYWWSLAASQFQAWLFLGLGALLLPQTWQERGSGLTRSASAWWERWVRWGLSAPEERARRRAAQMDINPVLWLAGCNRAVSRSLSIVVGAWALIALGVSLFPAANDTGMKVLLPTGIAFSFVIKSLMAVQSCRFFAEARRDGMLETLLHTPLTSLDIIRGQAQAFRQVATPPVAVFLGLLYAPALVHLVWGLAGGNTTGRSPSVLGLGFGGGLTLTLLLDLLAIQWFGMWLALKLKNPSYAAALTVLFVVILPSAGCAVCCVATLLSDLVFFLVGYVQLQNDLRQMVARQYEVVAGNPLPTSTPRRGQ